MMKFGSLVRPRRLLVIGVTLAASVTGCGGGQAREAKFLEKGRAYMDARNYEKARVEFQNALQVAPKDPVARYQMGLVDEKLLKGREAAQFYQSTIDVSADHVGARAHLARLYLFSSAPDRALELIKPVLVTHPDDPDLLTVRAAAKVQQKDLDGAEQDALRAVQGAPANEDAIAVLAGVYSSQGKKDKAQALLEQSLIKIPQSVDLRLVLAQVDLQLGRRDQAEEQLLKLVELQPDEKGYRLRLARFYVEASQFDAAETVLRAAVKHAPTDHDIKMSLVQFLAARRGKDVAEKELLSMIDAAPGDFDLKFALAEFHSQSGEDAQAETIYRQVIDTQKLDQAGLRARDLLAALRLKNNDAPAALALVNEVLDKSPRDDDALTVRGTIALSRQDPRAAIADLRAVLRDQPNSVGVIRTLARAHLANGEPAIAEETLRSAVEANPKNAALELDFADVLAQSGKPEQAEPVVAQLVTQNPDNVDALTAQFRIAMAAKDVPVAQSAADSIVTLQPKLGLGFLFQGEIAESVHRSEDALKAYAKAAELQPMAAEPLEAQVRVLSDLKRYPEAGKYLDAAIERDPSNGFAANLKGTMLLHIGQAAQARDAFRLAISRTPKWWIPYRGLAFAQLAAKDGIAAATATLKNAKAVVDEPDHICGELAVLYETQGQPDLAIAEYQEVLRRNPRSEIAANNLAMLLATYKKDPASLDQAKTLSARFADSSNVSFLDTYGWVLYKRGETAASIPVLSRVVAKAPDAVLARYHLGMAQSQAGDSADARDNLTRVVNSGSKFHGLDEAKAALDRIAKAPTT